MGAGRTSGSLLRPTVRPEVRSATTLPSEPSFLSLLRLDFPLLSGPPPAGWPTQRVFLRYWVGEATYQSVHEIIGCWVVETVDSAVVRQAI